MKNTFKFLTLALAASSLMFAACDDTPEPEPTPQDTTYTVTVNCNDATLGTVSIDPAQANYTAGTEVTITATPASNANFVNWNGTITDNPYTFTVSENATYTATFEAKPEPGYVVTFDGAALDVAGYSEALYANQNGTYLFLFGCAKAAEGTSVSLPYTYAMLSGTSAADLAIADAELYKDNVYQTSDGSQYGDWQLYRNGNHTFNCNALDMNTMTMSATMSLEMYSLTDVVENGASSDGSDATHKTLAMTFNDITFEAASKGGVFGKKMSK